MRKMRKSKWRHPLVMKVYGRNGLAPVSSFSMVWAGNFLSGPNAREQRGEEELESGDATAFRCPSARWHGARRSLWTVQRRRKWQNQGAAYGCGHGSQCFQGRAWPRRMAGHATIILADVNGFFNLAYALPLFQARNCRTDELDGQYQCVAARQYMRRPATKPAWAMGKTDMVKACSTY